MKIPHPRESDPGYSFPRTISTCSDYPHAVLGLSITLPLLREAESRGVKLIEDVPIARLVLHNGVVCGAIGLDARREVGQLLECGRKPAWGTLTASLHTT